MFHVLMELREMAFKMFGEEFREVVSASGDRLARGPYSGEKLDELRLFIVLEVCGFRKLMGGLLQVEFGWL